jgi:ribosomal protein L28
MRGNVIDCAMLMISNCNIARRRTLWQITMPLTLIAPNLLTSGEEPFLATLDKPVGSVLTKREIASGGVRHTFRKGMGYQQLKWSALCRHTSHRSNPNTVKTSWSGSCVHFVTLRACENCLRAVLQDGKFTTLSSVTVIPSGITQCAAIHMVACANC